MWSRKHTPTFPPMSVHYLQLCTNENYYRQLEPQYPRPKILQAGRWLLSHFALDALGLISIIYILWQDFVTKFVSEGPSMFSPKQMSHSFAWQLISHYPFVTVSIFLLLLLLIPLGFWMRWDQRKEKKALELRKEGLQLAAGYRAYLEYVVSKTGALPRLLRYDHPTFQTFPRDTMIFAPLKLVQTNLVNVRRMPLDKYESGKMHKVWDLDYHKTDTKPIPTPTLIVSRTIDALAHSGTIVVLGQPGSGKTTLLSHLIWEQAQAQLNSTMPSERVPVFLDLAMPDTANRDLQESIKAEVKNAAKVDEVVFNRIVEAIIQGPSLVVVDGLDELLGNARKSILARLEALAHRITPSTGADSNMNVPVQIAVSSRTSSFRKGDLSSQNFEIWELLPLTERESQRQLVAQVLGLQPISTTSGVRMLAPDQLLTSLEERPQTVGWSTNPLLLTLSALDWARSAGESLASTRVALYRNAIEELMKQRMKDWSAQEITEAISLAEDAALELFEQGRRSLTMQDFTERIAPRLFHRWGYRTSGHEKPGPGDVFLSWSGLFILNSNGRYDIYHLTFLEYLAARALARKLIKEWSSTPVDSAAFLNKLRASDLLDVNDLLTEGNGSDRNVLAYLWLKRTVARWTSVLLLLTGILSEKTDVDKLMSDLYQPDLAQAWIRVLLDQPDDIGLLGLRLAASCAAELTTTGWHIWTLVQEIADRLVSQLSRAVMENREGLKSALQRACTILAHGGEIGQEAICGALTDRLANPDERVRQAIAETIGTLGSLGKAAFPNLIAQLTESDQHVRKAVIEAIHLLGTVDIDVQRYLLPHLANSDSDVRVTVIRAIGTLRLSDTIVLNSLYDLLADNNETTAVHQEIVETIGAIGLKDARVLGILYDKLRDDNVNVAVRIAIVEVLSQLGADDADVLENLLTHLTDSNWRVRFAVVQAVGKLGPNGVPALSLISTILTNKNENTAVRQTCAWAIGMLGTFESSFLDDLSAILADEIDSLAVRQTVAWAIGMLGVDGAPALEILSACLANKNEEVAVRKEVAEAIKKIGITGIYVLRHLTPHLSDDKSEVRVAVVQAIGGLEYAGIPALENLVSILADESEDITVREAAAAAIGKIGNTEVDVLTYLVQHISDTKPEVRAAVVQAISTLGQDGVPALTILYKLLKDPDVNVREKVALAIGRFGKLAESALPALIKQLNDTDEDVYAAVEWAIRSIANTGIFVTTSLLDHLSRPRWQAKRTVAGIIKAFGPKSVAVLPQLLEQLIEPDESGIVREKVAQAIGAMSTVVTTPLPNLLTWLTDPDWRVREAMKRSLRELREVGVPVAQQLIQLLADLNLSREMRVAVVETIEALVINEQTAMTELYGILPTLHDMLANSNNLSIRQTIEKTIRVLQQVRGVAKPSFQVNDHLKDSPELTSKIEKDNANILDDLYRKLRDSDWHERELAVQKIGTLASSMEWSAPLLIEALADAEPIVSDSAALVLSTHYPDILNDALLQDLREALTGHLQGIFLAFEQRNELNLYAALGKAAYPFLDRIVALLNAEHWSVRENAIHVLGTLRRIPYTLMNKLLLLYKEDTSLAVHKAAEEALEAILSLDDILEDVDGEEI